MFSFHSSSYSEFRFKKGKERILTFTSEPTRNTIDKNFICNLLDVALQNLNDEEIEKILKKTHILNISFVDKLIISFLHVGIVSRTKYESTSLEPLAFTLEEHLIFLDLDFNEQRYFASVYNECFRQKRIVPLRTDKTLTEAGIYILGAYNSEDANVPKIHSILTQRDIYSAYSEQMKNKYDLLEYEVFEKEDENENWTELHICRLDCEQKAYIPNTDFISVSKDDVALNPIPMEDFLRIVHCKAYNPMFGIKYFKYNGKMSDRQFQRLFEHSIKV